MPTAPIATKWTPEAAAGGIRTTHGHAPGDSYTPEHTHRIPLTTLSTGAGVIGHRHDGFADEVLDRTVTAGLVSDTEVSVELRADRSVRITAANPAYLAQIIAEAVEQLIDSDIDELDERVPRPGSYVDEHGDKPYAAALAEWIVEHVETIDSLPVTLAQPLTFVSNVRAMLGDGR